MPAGTTCQDSPYRFFEPAAGAFLAAFGQPFPVVASLLLGLADDLEGDGLVENELRPALMPTNC